MASNGYDEVNKKLMSTDNVYLELANMLNMFGCECTCLLRLNINWKRFQGIENPESLTNIPKYIWIKISCFGKKNITKTFNKKKWMGK